MADSDPIVLYHCPELHAKIQAVQCDRNRETFRNLPREQQNTSLLEYCANCPGAVARGLEPIPLMDVAKREKTKAADEPRATATQVRTLLRDKGMTIAETARRMGIARSQIDSALHNKRATMLGKVAAFLQTQPKNAFQYRKPPKAPIRPNPRDRRPPMQQTSPSPRPEPVERKATSKAKDADEFTFDEVERCLGNCLEDVRSIRNVCLEMGIKLTVDFERLTDWIQNRLREGRDGGH